MNQKMIDAYICEVTRRVQEAQRKDLGEELQSLIEDEHHDSQNSTEAILTNLGDPKLLALRYGAKSRALIGPVLYESYGLALKIVALVVGIGILVANIVGFLFQGSFSLVDLIFGWIGGWVNGFAFVTIGFMIAEYFADKDEMEKLWSVSDLDLESDTYPSIARVDAGFQMAFAMVALVIYRSFSQLIAVYGFGDTLQTVPLLNASMPAWLDMFFTVGLILILASGLTKMILASITPLYAIINSVFAGFATLAMVIALLYKGFYNPSLNRELIALGFGNDIDYFGVLTRVGIILAVVLIVNYLYQTLYSFFKSGILKKEAFRVTVKKSK